MNYEEECAVEVRVYFGYNEDGGREVRCDRRYADGHTVFNRSWMETVIDDLTSFTTCALSTASKKRSRETSIARRITSKKKSKNFS